MNYIEVKTGFLPNPVAIVHRFRGLDMYSDYLNKLLDCLTPPHLHTHQVDNEQQYPTYLPYRSLFLFLFLSVNYSVIYIW